MSDSEFWGWVLVGLLMAWVIGVSAVEKIVDYFQENEGRMI